MRSSVLSRRAASVDGWLNAAKLLAPLVVVMTFAATLPPASAARVDGTQGLSGSANPSSVASGDVLKLAGWVTASLDNAINDLSPVKLVTNKPGSPGSPNSYAPQRQAFIIIDKRQARLFVFAGEGNLVASSPVLMGAAQGDYSVPGIGERPMSGIRLSERTTPAGRFQLEPGNNIHGEDIFWVDYDAAVSLHRVRANNPSERRLQRLVSSTPLDNRISYGCINVPQAFYDKVVRPMFNKAGGLIYILPEKRPVREFFGRLEQKAHVLKQFQRYAQR